MKIYSGDQELPFTLSSFPDGQPHFKLGVQPRNEEVTIESRIKSPEELMNILLAKDVLSRWYGVNLDIRYLMGARMDRPIDNRQPFTLNVVARMINSAGFRYVRLLDVHSPEAEGRIYNSYNVEPIEQVRTVLRELGDVRVVVPDKGAIKRSLSILNKIDEWRDAEQPWVQCEKTRDSATGKLSGFKVIDPSLVKGRRCLIIDDICDGGGTFTGIAQELRKAGATEVHLYVTHGIFSKKLPLEGIDTIYTTDSYHDWNKVAGFSVDKPFLTCLPISMNQMYVDSERRIK